MTKKDEYELFVDWIEDNIKIEGNATGNPEITRNDDGRVSEVDADSMNIEWGDWNFTCSFNHEKELLGDSSGDMLEHVITKHWKDIGFDNESEARNCIDD